MLLFSLTGSVLLLLIVNWFAWTEEHGFACVVGSCAVFLAGSLFLMCLLPALGIQSVLLGIAAGVWRSKRWSPRLFLGLSSGATLAAYLLAGILVLASEREYARLRTLYPYESMEARLPGPEPAQGTTGLPPATRDRLARLDEMVEQTSKGTRNFQIEILHEHAIDLFINSPGFGIARMIHPSEFSLANSLRREPVPLQPGSRFLSIWSPGVSRHSTVADGTLLSPLLDDSIVDFVNGRGFGYFKDRRHVAGFETHRFSRVPEPEQPWRIQSLELISLLLHDEPQVYNSDHLPRMEQTHTMPTRPLDRFEWFALHDLQQGEDIITTRESEGLRMLGAVRSLPRCVNCHGGEKGALLGAFSYTLSNVMASP